MIRFITSAAFALVLATSAQAMSPVPLHQSDGHDHASPQQLRRGDALE